MTQDTYSVIRFFREGHPRETVATGLTRNEAKEMCGSDDGHSSTCGDAEGVRLFALYGEWLLGFEKE